MKGEVFAIALLCVSSVEARAADAGIVEQLSAARPTPCLDAVSPVTVSGAAYHFAVSGLAGYGRGAGAPATWSPGHSRFDEAARMLQRAIVADSDAVTVLGDYGAKRMLLMRIELAKPDVQAEWLAIAKSPTGKLFWEYVLDGASCQGAINSLLRQPDILTDGEKGLLASWNERLSGKDAEFNAAYRALSEGERRKVDEAIAGFKRLLPSTPEEKQIFKDSLASPELTTEKMGPLLIKLAPEVQALVRAEADEAAHR